MKYYAIFEDDWPNSMKLTNHGHFQSWDEAADTFDKLFGAANLGSKWKLVKLDDVDRMYHHVVYDLTKSEALALAAMVPPSPPQPSGRAIARVAILGLSGPLVVSLIGPVYFGYSHAPYWRVIAWALASTICFFWWMGTSAFKSALSGEAATLPFWIKLMNVVLIITWATFGFIAGDSLAYVLVRSISEKVAG